MADNTKVTTSATLLKGLQQRATALLDAKSKSLMYQPPALSAIYSLGVDTKLEMTPMQSEALIRISISNASMEVEDKPAAKGAVKKTPTRQAVLERLEASMKNINESPFPTDEVNKEIVRGLIEMKARTGFGQVAGETMKLTTPVKGSVNDDITRLKIQPRLGDAKIRYDEAMTLINALPTAVKQELGQDIAIKAAVSLAYDRTTLTHLNQASAQVKKGDPLNELQKKAIKDLKKRFEPKAEKPDVKPEGFNLGAVINPKDFVTLVAGEGSPSAATVRNATKVAADMAVKNSGEQAL